jgi:histone acetyltransferase 1
LNNFSDFNFLHHLLNFPGSAAEKNFELYSCTIEEPGFRLYHERLQTFLLWYVDAASFIDVDDDRWRFFLM